ncbi:uncharacterized protein [Malus domestica]|uniref:uncharacterized protein n=1 Tax=Malus domestica TaxID=3750 RepID=UPI003976ECA5
MWCRMRLSLYSMVKQISKSSQNVFPPIPRHRFFLQDYNTLYPHLNKVDILTDVIGHLTAIQHLEPKQINQRVAYKCDIHIQNVRREQLTVTLWGDVAEEFCSSSVQALPLPIVVIFTSLKVKLYLDKIVMNSTDCSLLLFDPNIPEVNAYKSVFANCNEPVKILAPFSRQVNEAEILRTTKMFTIDEVAFLDLDLHKNDTFFCKACVKCFDTRYQWWYSAYANCVKQMHRLDNWTADLPKASKPNSNSLVMFNMHSSNFVLNICYPYLLFFLYII